MILFKLRLMQYDHYWKGINNRVGGFCMTHLQQIKAGGYRVFISKVKSLTDKALLLISGILAIPCVLLIRSLKKIVLFRIGPIRTDRIGHFAADSGQQFAANSLGIKRVVNLYWISKYISNTHLEKMVRRNFLIFDFVRYLDYWNLLLPGGADHIRLSSHTRSRDVSGVLQKTRENMSFLSCEEDQAKEWMSNYGWKEGDPFVCILVRDSMYLKNNDLYKQGVNYDYHNYRDSNIDNYVEAMEWLANQGVWVFRMGREMHKPVSSAHSKIIDYAFCEKQSDLLDIWMFANCNLCISTGSGPDMVSDIYRRPLLLVNLIPIVHMFSWSDATHLPRNLVYRKTGKNLTFSEHLKHSYTRSEDYSNAGIDIVELSSIEILHAVQERFKNIFEGCADSNRNLELNDIVWNIVLSDDKASELHGFIHKNSCIANSFLKNNPDWLK